MERAVQLVRSLQGGWSADRLQQAPPAFLAWEPVEDIYAVHLFVVIPRGNRTQPCVPPLVMRDETRGLLTGETIEPAVQPYVGSSDERLEIRRLETRIGA